MSEQASTHSPPPPPPPPPSPPPPPPPPPSAQSGVPAGWYFDGVGQRWWDGGSWGPAAPPQTDSNDSILATLSHLGFLIGGLILPLVLYLIADDRNRPETRHHAREALNFQLTTLVIQFAVVVLGAVTAIGLAVVGPAADPGDSGFAFGAGFVLFFAVFPVVMLLVIGSIVFSVIAAVRAYQGNRYRYPLCIRFVRS